MNRHSPIMAKITPKVVADFTRPRPSVEHLVAYYRPLIERAGHWIWIWATGNADHALSYSGAHDHDRAVPWARYSAYSKGVAERNAQGECVVDNFCAGPFWTIREDTLSYRQIAGIVEELRAATQAVCPDVKVIEYVDPGPEFCESPFKDAWHPEILTGWTGAVDVRAALMADSRSYAAWPKGIPEGLPVRDFVAGQCRAYCEELEFDGVYLGNQFGTREWWDPARAHGYSDEEARLIELWFRTMKQAMGPDRLVYWMDSYWEVSVEHDRWSVPLSAYQYMDGIVCSAWNVIIQSNDQVRRNVESKLALSNRPTIFFQVDHVDPWYRYNAIDYLRPRYLRNVEMFYDFVPRVDGLKFQANDEWGKPVPKPEIDLLVDALDGKPFPGGFSICGIDVWATHVEFHVAYRRGGQCSSPNATSRPAGRSFPAPRVTTESPRASGCNTRGTDTRGEPGDLAKRRTRCDPRCPAQIGGRCR